MARVLIAYYSRTGNTKKLADAIEESVKQENVEVIKKRVEDINVDELLEFDGIIIGSPTYYGTLAWQVKKLIDESVKYHGKLKGKIGAAFTTSGNIGGGNETTILSILEAFLIHGMIVQGEHRYDHYGAVGIRRPDEKALKGARKLGKTVANLVEKLHGSSKSKSGKEFILAASAKEE